MKPLLEINNLSVDFHTTDNIVHAVDDISFSIHKGETVALVGESGSGKSVTAHSILKLLPYPTAKHPLGSIIFDGEELIDKSEQHMMGIRGRKVGMIFQEPMTSLNPLHTIEKQITEILFIHTGLSKIACKEKVLKLLKAVGIKKASSRLGAFPHELSGGQRQRIMIAMAIANEPSLLVADEPTTALDVTIQIQVLNLLKDLQTKMNMAMLLISHDLGVVRNFSDKVAVMQNGKIVEYGNTQDIFNNPQHEYTIKLINAGEGFTPATIPENNQILLNTDNLKVYFPIKKGFFKKVVDNIKAVDGVSINVKKGHSLGIVGESGSGKTTLALAILKLIESTGDINLNHQNINIFNKKQIIDLRNRLQIVFQDPFGSLSPRMSILQIVEEGLLVHSKMNKDEREQSVIDALTDVGIDPTSRHRYPHEFSGGQRQRIAIARAIILKPEIIILDEPTSALDRTIQFQVINLLKSLQEKQELTYLFISHDLKVIKALCHDIVVMKDGKIVEYGNLHEIYNSPKQEYTKNLLNSAFEL